MMKNLPEEVYDHWDLFIGDSNEDIKNSWKNWNDSQLSIMYNQQDRPGSGPSGSSMVAGKSIMVKS